MDPRACTRSRALRDSRNQRQPWDLQSETGITALRVGGLRGRQFVSQVETRRDEDTKIETDTAGASLGRGHVVSCVSVAEFPSAAKAAAARLQPGCVETTQTQQQASAHEAA